ncbi:MAG: site-specific integrase [Lachnospiraceae bacterium]|nr:site-specific integrase [Lachnospiraceae bacterium]
MGKRSNGEGTICKRKDGRWCAAFYDETYVRHFVYGKTQAEVKKKLKEKRNEKNVEKPVKDQQEQQGLTFQEWIEQFLVNYKKNEIKITTYEGYIRIYRKHIKDTQIGKAALDQVTTEILQAYYNDKLNDGYNSKTVRAISIVIGAALNMAVKLKMLSENPNRYTSIPKKKKYEAAVLNVEEVRRIVKEAKAEEIYPIVVTTVYTGMRKGEVMALKWENVDFQSRRIYIKNSLCRIGADQPDEKGRRHARYEILEPKTKESIRMVPMVDEVYDALMLQKERQESDKQKYREIYMDQGLVFAEMCGDYLPQRQFMDKYHAFLRKYDITDIRFHDLRHTFATLLIESDVSMKVVQELLGHSSITTSMDIYTHVSDAKKEQALACLRERNAGGGV